jgi:sialic acid synthase SpsE
MDTLREAFGYTVGYSDHTPGLAVPLAAVARGARVIEKHFTLDRSLPGPDHRASLEPDELRSMIEGIRIVESALGDGRKRPAPSEANTAEVARKSIVADRDIAKGEALSAEMFAMRRPGTGLAPRLLALLEGRSAARDIPAGTVVDLEMVR